MLKKYLVILVLLTALLVALILGSLFVFKKSYSLKESSHTASI
jgi:uncharacterized protein YpmB